MLTQMHNMVIILITSAMSSSIICRDIIFWVSFDSNFNTPVGLTKSLSAITLPN